MINSEWDIDSASSVPKHLQLAQHIKAHIEMGEWKPGDKLPSERDLIKLTGISRETVRHTLAVLAQQGIIEKTHGSGTFVRQPRYETPMHVVYSFSEQLRGLGVTLQDTWLAREVIPATETLALKLGLQPDDPVIHIRRLRRVQHTPIMVSSAYIPQALCPALVDETDYASLYALLTEKYSIPILTATDWLEAISADADLARCLGVPRRSPVMSVERRATTTQDVILHLGFNYIRGDMCRFRSDMRAQPTALEFKLPSV